jgi:hypothetical protein
LAAVTVAVVALAACSGAERSLLERFFGASRLRDTTALQSLSTVIFEPREQGIVRTFEITGVTDERVEGQSLIKEVTIEAPVILPDGQTAQKTLVVTLQRSRVETGGRWLITAVRDAGAFQAVPPS